MTLPGILGPSLLRRLVCFAATIVLCAGSCSSGSGGVAFSPTCPVENVGGGTYLACSSAADYHTITTPIIVLADQSFTVGGWVKRSVTGRRENLLVIYGSGTESSPLGKLWLQFAESDAFVFAMDGSGTTTCNSCVASSDAGAWVHWTVTLDASSLAMVIHKDGVSQTPNMGGTASATNQASGPALIGGLSSCNNFNGEWSCFTQQGAAFTGSIDELRILVGVAFSTAQVLDMMTSVNNNVAGLILSLSFDDASNLLLDYSCGGSNDANSERSNGVTAATGKVCGAVSATAVEVCGGCPPLTAPDAGTMSCTNDANDGSICTFSCDNTGSERSLAGDESRTCTNLAFTGTSPACICSAGFTAQTSSDTCDACESGTFKSSTGDASCTACDANSDSPAGSGGGDDCLCNAGYTGTLSGTTSLSGSCAACSAGQFKSASGTATCQTCTAGQYSSASTAAASCTACPAGTFKGSPGQGEEADCDGTCPANSNSAAGSDAVADCLASPGYTGDVSSGITICPAQAFKADTSSAACTACTGGLAPNPGSTSCPCAPEFYGDASGSAPCTACPAHSNTGGAQSASTCTCNSGFFGDPVAGGVACQQCLADTYKASGTTNDAGGCLACPDNSNTNAAKGSTVVTQCKCDAGYDPSSGPCSACNAGKFKIAATSNEACLSCAVDTYQGAAAQTECSTCTGGSSTLSADASVTCSCTAGYSGNAEGNLPCASCGESAFSTTNGAVGCTGCPGNAPSVNASTACRCEAGFWSPDDYIVTADGSCIQCPAAYASQCLGGGTCATGYANYGCASCAAKFYTVDNRCFDCPSIVETSLVYTLMAAVCMALVFWTFHLAKVQAKKEALGAFFYFTQEACLTMNINLSWPQQLLDIFSWISTLFNLQISFAGPECFGEWGFAGRWAANVLSPLILLVIHGIVYLVKLKRAKSDDKDAIFWQLKGSGVFWLKMLFMMMLNLIFQIWVCEKPTTSANATTVEATRLVKDPSITCNGSDGSQWPGLLAGSVVLFGAFGLAFPLGSYWIVSTASQTLRNTDEQFRVSYGVLYATFDTSHWWWYVVPVTARRVLLQALSLALERQAYVQAGLFIAIHAIYGGSLAFHLPYLDPVQDISDQGSSSITALDLLALIHSAIQICLVVIGLMSNEENGVIITGASMILYAIGAAASAYVFGRIKKRSTRAAKDAQIVKDSAKGSFDTDTVF